MLAPVFGRGAHLDQPNPRVAPQEFAHLGRIHGPRGRPSNGNLEMITLVVAVLERISESVGPEHTEIMRICQNPCSVTEISAAANLPLIVVKVILSDLIERGYVIHRSPPAASEDAPSLELLQAVLHGIRKL